MAQIIKINQDSLVNKRTGLGTFDYDSTINSQFGGLSFGSENYVFLSRLYRKAWQIQKVCEYFPSEMTKMWGVLKLENNIELQKKANNYLKSLQTYYREGQTFANLYGGAGYVRFIEDGRELEEPIDYENIKSIEHSRLYDRWELNINYDSAMITNDPYNPDYYYFFSYAPNGKENIRTGQRIHKDRVLRFRGVMLPPFEQINNNGWEDSVLQTFLQPLKNYLAGLGYVVEALRNFEVIVLKTLDLHEALAGSNQQLIEQRGKEIASELSSLRPLMLDKNNEDMTIVSRNFNNVVEIVQLAMQEMIASSGIDSGEFYKQKDQIKANSKEERLATSGRILALQKKKWQSLIEEDIKLFLAPYQIKEEDWEWEWTNTYTETEDEKVEREDKISQTMERYLNLGVLTIEEVRKSLFDNSDSRIMLNQQSFNAMQQEKEENKMNMIASTQPKEDETVMQKTSNKDAKPRFFPDGEVLPDSFYESLSIAELMKMPED